MRRVIRVQAEPFDLAIETAQLTAGDTACGAVASFIGLVRNVNQVGSVQSDVAAMTLEHYPGMTEKALGRIVEAAAGRWPLRAVTLIHRVGSLSAGEPIVLVLTASAHRRAAFESCEYIMDILKTEAPFWKKERLGSGEERWVDARESDGEAAARWLKSDT